MAFCERGKHIKMKKKLALLLVLVVAVVAVLMGCGGPAQIEKPKPDEGATVFDVTGSCKAELNGDTLIVSGETNLMDGTNGVIAVFNSDGTKAADQKFTKQGNEIKAEFKVGSDWSDVVYGNIMFDNQKSDGQPDAVKEAYGKHFQNLTGNAIIWDKNGNIVVFQSEEVKIK